MKVLFVHRRPSLASARVRVIALAPHLRALGVECETVEHPDAAFELGRILARADADAVVLQKKTPNLLEGLAWRSCRVPLVFDFDDAVLFRVRPKQGTWESPTRRARFERALARATAFACGNEYLASFCQPSGKPVLLAPSTVPTDVPQARGPAPGAPLRLGWIGAPHNLHELEALGPTLRVLAREIDLVLTVVSAESLELDGVRVEHVPWKLETQEEEIARFDVGLMPLVDSPWTRGKCGYKLLQYMAAGVPAIASPVGANRDIVTHEDNGLLAESPADFGRAIRRLWEAPELGRRVGLAGRATVASRFARPVVARAWAEFLSRLATS